jgi:hypothetical protein
MMIKNNIHHQTDRENGSTGHLMCFFFLSNVETNNSLSYTKKIRRSFDLICCLILSYRFFFSYIFNNSTNISFISIDHK